MNKIEVDEAMRKRILSYVENLNLETEKAAKSREESKIRQFRRRTVRNITAAAACIAILLVCTFAWPKLTGPGELETKESVSIANGMVEVKSIDELSAAVGFPVNEVEGLPFTVEKEVYISYWGEMAQIEYTGEGETAVFRKGTGTDDVSGDYNVYSSVKEIMAGANPVTLKGENDVFTLAVWTDGNYSYSLDISKGLSEDEWSEMIQLACVNASDFSGACSSLIKIMNAETRRAFISMDSQKLSDVDKKLFEELMNCGMTQDTLVYSLKELSELLERVYGRKVIVLIDEYDVPLAKANENGYYDEMALLIRRKCLRSSQISCE